MDNSYPTGSVEPDDMFDFDAMVREYEAREVIREEPEDCIYAWDA